MKYLVPVLLFLAAHAAAAQSFRKYPVGNTGCSLYNYCALNFKVEYSTDSSKVYTGECASGDVTYGIICVQLLHPVNDPAVAEELMIAYTDFLKSSFTISKAAGYGKGHRLANRENTRGILDYWEDSEGDQWKIKAWTDGNFIGFLYAYSSKALPEPKVNAFLDGFRLPGM